MHAIGKPQDSLVPIQHIMAGIRIRRRKIFLFLPANPDKPAGSIVCFLRAYLFLLPQNCDLLIGIFRVFPHPHVRAGDISTRQIKHRIFLICLNGKELLRHRFLRAYFRRIHPDGLYHCTPFLRAFLLRLKLPDTDPETLFSP